MPDPLPQLPRRDPAGHKGTFGTVCVIGGCARPDAFMLGAPSLTARAALRSGCGLAKLLVPRPLLLDALAQTPSATARGLPTDDAGTIVPHLAAEVFDEATDPDAPGSPDCIAIGPGLGPAVNAAPITLRALGQTETPVVADADALNALAETPDFQRDIRAAAVITPHPGEFRRLAAPLNISHDPTRRDSRVPAAEALAQRLGVVVVLKGMRTVVSDGLRTWTCDRGHPCLATAGTGDVLTGVVASLVAQYVPRGPVRLGGVKLPAPPDRPLDLFNAARLAVEAHAIAGELWAEHASADAGMLAAELADILPTVLTAMRA